MIGGCVVFPERKTDRKRIGLEATGDVIRRWRLIVMWYRHVKRNLGDPDRVKHVLSRW